MLDRADEERGQARQLFRKLGIGPGNSLLGGLAVCVIPLPYVFYKVSLISARGSRGYTVLTMI